MSDAEVRELDLSSVDQTAEFEAAQAATPSATQEQPTGQPQPAQESQGAQAETHKPTWTEDIIRTRGGKEEVHPREQILKWAEYGRYATEEQARRNQRDALIRQQLAEVGVGMDENGNLYELPGWTAEPEPPATPAVPAEQEDDAVKSLIDPYLKPFKDQIAALERQIRSQAIEAEARRYDQQIESEINDALSAVMEENKARIPADRMDIIREFVADLARENVRDAFCPVRDANGVPRGYQWATPLKDILAAALERVGRAIPDIAAVKAAAQQEYLQAKAKANAAPARGPSAPVAPKEKTPQTEREWEEFIARGLEEAGGESPGFF